MVSIRPIFQPFRKIRPISPRMTAVMHRIEIMLIMKFWEVITRMARENIKLMKTPCVASLRRVPLRWSQALRSNVRRSP